jgi:hypothetical protein
MNTITTIETCAALRSWLSEAMILALSNSESISEKEFCQRLQIRLSSNPDIYSGGWYDPPPSGISALFGTPDNYQRLQYDNLRKPEFWPQDKHKLEGDGVGILYGSPIDIDSGTIGDFGITIYNGKDKRIIDHLSNCLNVLEVAIDQIEIGMEMREIHNLTQTTIAQRGLTNARTVTWTDKVGTNLGHTIPWSYEKPNSTETEIIASKNLPKVSNLISSKRINVNRLEKFKIPHTIAFTLEARLESLNDPGLPNVFYHFIVCFKEEQKSVLANFNKLFQAIGPSDIQCKFR